MLKRALQRAVPCKLGIAPRILGTPFRARGFSLIELAVVLVVLAVVIALGAPAFAQWIQNSHIRNSTESLAHGMLRARAEAVQRNVGTTFTLGNGAFWTVTELNANQVIETRPAAELPPSITLTVLPNPAGGGLPTDTLTYTSIGTLAANANGSAAIAQIDVDSSALSAGSSRPLRILIGVGGIVRSCDPNPDVAATDPRHC